MVDDIEELLANVERKPAAAEASIAACEAKLGATLPADYLEFLRHRNGGEGSLGEAFVMLWAVEDLAPLNESYEVEQNAPGLLIFGSDGGGEAYGFDRRASPWQVVRVPFIGMEWDVAKPIGSSFVTFIRHLREAR